MYGALFQTCIEVYDFCMFFLFEICIEVIRTASVCTLFSKSVKLVCIFHRYIYPRTSVIIILHYNGYWFVHLGTFVLIK